MPPLLNFTGTRQIFITSYVYFANISDSKSHSQSGEYQIDNYFDNDEINVSLSIWYTKSGLDYLSP